MNVAEKKERRRLIAANVLDGVPLKNIADKYGVCFATIKTACAENGVMVVQKKLKTPKTFEILRRLLDGETPKSLMEKYSCSKAWVYEIRQQAIAAGFQFGKPPPAEETQPTEPQPEVNK